MKKNRLAIPHFTPPPRCALVHEALGKFKTFKAALKSRAEAKPKANEFLIYDLVGESWWDENGITPKKAKDWLDGLPADVEEIDVRINSPGGDVFDGVAIYNLLLNSGKIVNIHIDGIAASIASIIAMVGDEIRIVGNGEMMVHKAWTIAAGNADDFEKEVAALKSIDGNLVATYVARTGQSEKEINDMMAATTWMNPKEAEAKGFVDVIEPLKQKPGADADDDGDGSIAARAFAQAVAASLAEQKAAVEAAAKQAAEDKAKAEANAARMNTLRQKALAMRMHADAAA